MKAIVVCHHPDNKEFLDNLLASIHTSHPVAVCTAGVDRPVDSYELGAIRWAAERFEEFILLQDTCEIKDNSLFDKLFAIPGHVVLTRGNFHYMGKFVTKDLPPLPVVTTKADSVAHETRWLNGKPFSCFEPDLPVHTAVFEEKFGQKRMRLENDYVIKWKGTYSL